MARLDVGRLRAIAGMVDRMGWQGFFKSLVALTAANFVAAFLGIVDSVASVPVALFDMLAAATTAILGAVLVDPVSIPSAGASTAIQWLTTGGGVFTGPFAFPIGVASMMAGLFVFAKGMDALDMDLPGWDVPGVRLFGNEDD